MADTGPLGDRAEREPLHPTLGQLSFGCGKECGAQIAVVIGARVGLGGGLWAKFGGITCHPFDLPSDLSTVKIFLDRFSSIHILTLSR